MESSSTIPSWGAICEMLSIECECCESSENICIIWGKGERKNEIIGVACTRCLWTYGEVTKKDAKRCRRERRWREAVFQHEQKHKAKEQRKKIKRLKKRFWRGSKKVSCDQIVEEWIPSTRVARDRKHIESMRIICRREDAIGSGDYPNYFNPLWMGTSAGSPFLNLSCGGNAYIKKPETTEKKEDQSGKK